MLLSRVLLLACGLVALLSVLLPSSVDASLHATTQLATTTILTPAEASAYITARYGSSSRVDQVRGAIPRWGRTDKIGFGSDSNYPMEVVYTVAPGAALFIVTLLIWIVFSFVQCCCCKPDVNKQYTANQIRVPMLMAFLFSLVIVAFAIIGLVATENFHTQISGSDGIGTTATVALTNVDTIFANANTRLQNVSAMTTEFAADINTKLNSLTDLGTGLPGLISDINTFGANIAAISPLTVYQDDPAAPGAPSDPITYACTFCTAAPSSLTSITTSLTSAMPTYNSIASLKATAQSSIVDAQSQIESAISDAASQVSTIQVQAEEYQGHVSDANDQVDKYEKIRRAVILVIFIVPLFLVLLFWIFTLGRKSEGCTKVLIHLFFPAGIIIYIIFMVHLPLALVTADGCHYLDQVDPDLAAETTLSIKVTTALTACLVKENLLVALNVTNELDFTNTIVYPTIPSIDVLLDSTPLTTMQTTVDSLTMTSIVSDYDSSAKYTLLDQLNTLTSPTTFNLSTVHSCVPSDYSQVNETRLLRNTILTDLIIETKINSTIAAVQQNMTNIMTTYATLRNLTVKLVDVDLPALYASINPVLQSAQRAVDSATCSPLDDNYATMKATFCNRMIVSASALAMSAFFVGVFLFGLNFCCWFLIYRMARGPDSTISVAPADQYAFHGGGDGGLASPSKIHQGGAGPQNMVFSDNATLTELSAMPTATPVQQYY